MKLNDEFMQNAIARINELQKEIKEQSKTIEGAQEYIQRQLKLYKEDEALRHRAVLLQKEGQKIANDFFKQHDVALDSARKSIKEIQKLEEKFDIQ